jgi:uncharacterized membrane protein HdeD (DUF308 family)
MATIQVEGAPPHKHSSPYTSWVFLSGVATAVAGLVLICLALKSTLAPLLILAALFLICGSVLEVITGASLQRHLGPGVFHIVSGGIALTLGLFLIGLLPWQPGIFSAAPVALMIAIFSICNGLLRGLDLIISRPQDAISEGINTVCSLGVGVFLLENWRTASPSTIAFVTGILVLACGIAIAGSSWVQSKIEE